MALEPSEIEAAMAPRAEQRRYRPRASAVRPAAARPFGPGEVRLLDGPLSVSQEAAARNLADVDVDRLLAPFVTTSAADPKAPAYLGWETRLLPGVALSFWLSGAARMALLRDRDDLRGKVSCVLDELERCQFRNDGYLLGTTGGRHIFARVEREGCFPGFGFWGRGEATPYYALEKLLSGLRDVYRLLHEPKALAIAVGVGDWLERHMERISDAQLQELMRLEYGGMNWVLADLYADTGQPRFLAMSRRWHDHHTVVPLTEGRDVLEGVHANMQFPKFAGLAARYPLLGDEGDLRGARLFWESVVRHRTYATGGNSESEYFGPRDRLRLTPFTAENCNEYNMLRLTQLLANVEPRAEYAEYCERTLLNHLLAAQNPFDGRVCYFTSLIPGAGRLFQPLTFFSCCTASGLDSYARPAEYLYGRAEDAVLVHQFFASEVIDRERGVRLRQETTFPEGESSSITLRCERPASFELRIRNPAWALGRATVAVNGGEPSSQSGADGYFRLRRTWSDGDRVEVRYPMPLRTESLPGDPDTVALFRGPVLLAACLDDEQADALAEANEAPALLVEDEPVDRWFVPGDEPSSYLVSASRPKPLKVVPFHRRTFGAFAVYWRRMTAEGWRERLDAHRREEEEAVRLDDCTVDRVTAGAEEEEAAHGLAGTSVLGRGNETILLSRVWRTSRSDAFGYDLGVDSGAPMALACRFMGRESYEEWACRITVDGVTIRILERKKDDAQPVVPWRAVYPIGEAATRGKTKVRIRFEPLEPGRMKMPRLMELRSVRVGGDARQ
jgi:uncharacterized protein